MGGVPMKVSRYVDRFVKLPTQKVSWENKGGPNRKHKKNHEKQGWGGSTIWRPRNKNWYKGGGAGRFLRGLKKMGLE